MLIAPSPPGKGISTLQSLKLNITQPSVVAYVSRQLTPQLNRAVAYERARTSRLITYEDEVGRT